MGFQRCLRGRGGEKERMHPLGQRSGVGCMQIGTAETHHSVAWLKVFLMFGRSWWGEWSRWVLVMRLCVMLCVGCRGGNRLMRRSVRRGRCVSLVLAEQACGAPSCLQAC